MGGARLLLIGSCAPAEHRLPAGYGRRMYLAAPVCPNCSGALDSAGSTEAPHWHCAACDLIVLDTPETATQVGEPARDA